MNERAARVRASTYGKTPTELAARIAEYDRRDRLRRAGRRFLPIFGAGCAALLVPPHVLWLSLFTLTATFLALQRYRQQREILVLAGPCPDCAIDQPLPLPDKLPAIQRCAACGAFLKLEET